MCSPHCQVSKNSCYCAMKLHVKHSRRRMSQLCLRRELRKTMLDVAENLSRYDVKKIEFALHLMNASTTASGSDGQQRDGIAVLEELMRRAIWLVDLQRRECQLKKLGELLTDIGRPDLVSKLVHLEKLLYGAWSHDGSLPRTPTLLPMPVVGSPDAEAAYEDLETDSEAHIGSLSNGSALQVTWSSSHSSGSGSTSSSRSSRSSSRTSQRLPLRDICLQSDATRPTIATASSSEYASQGSCGFVDALEALWSWWRNQNNVA